MADQALSSATNFGVTIAVARAVSPPEFGAFAVVYALSFALLQLSRAMGTEPLVVRFSGAPDRERRTATESAAGAAVAVAVPGGAMTACAALAFDGALRSALLALAAVLPGLLLQDAWRFGFFAMGRPARAAANDLVWALAQVAAVGAVLAGGWTTAGAFVLAWGGAATLAAAFGFAQTGLRPRPGRLRAWLRQHSDLVPRYVGEFAVFRSSAQLTLYLVGAVAGLAALGSLRAAQVLLGPLNVVYLGATAFAVPEAARAGVTSPGRLGRLALQVSGTLTVISLAWGVCLLLLPDDVGRALLGAMWPLARPLLVPVLIGAIASAATVGPWVALRALGAASASLRARSTVAAINAVGGVSGALLGGAPGAAYGLAAGSLASVAVWWQQHAKAKASLRVAPDGAVPAAPSLHSAPNLVREVEAT